MKINDIGVLFDVSGSMQTPFNHLGYCNSSIRAHELINILERICSKGNRTNNEQIRIFSIIFGGKNELFYDFCNLIEISNRKFSHTLTSSNGKASKSGYGKNIQEVLSDYGSKTLYLDNYIFCESGPTERLCEMGYYLLKEDYDLRKSIYDSLPEDCKSFWKDTGVYGMSFFSFVQKRINRGTTDVINDIYKKCIDRYVSKIIYEEISQRRNNGNSLRFLNGNDLVNMKKNLDGKLTSPDNNNFNLLDLFKNYIYGMTPLYTSLKVAFENFQKQSNYNNNKYLFIISDGELNDINKNFDYIGEIRQKAQSNNVIIISIFLTSNSIPKEEKLYDNIQSHFTSGSKDLFLMSSTLTYDQPIIKFLIQKGWDIPVSGECKLFVEVNNSQNLNKFIDLINEAIGELNYKNNIENVQNPNSLINLLSSTNINNYVNSEVINKFDSKEQEGLTCYANAISAGICLASARVKGRPQLNFFDVKKKIIDKYDKGQGGNTLKILKEFAINYRLHSKEVSEEEARKEIMKTCPCITRFKLTAMQWGNFRKFFAENPKGILTKEIINQNNYYPNEKEESHSVLLTHISKDYLKFLNSWGNNFADNGYFKVKDGDVLGAIFYDISWELSDLTKEEIESYNNYMNELKNDINNYVFS